MDWTQFFNPSSWGSFAPSMMSPAADPMAAASGKSGVTAPVSAPGNASRGPSPQTLFSMGQQLMNPKMQPMQMQPIQYYRPNVGGMGMLG